MDELAQLFSDAAKDAFLEISNIGIGRAAATMSDLVGRRVNIAVPELSFHHVGECCPFKGFADCATVQVRQFFYGELSGEAILALSKQGAMCLAKLLLDEVDMEDAFGDNEQGAILETGNIMIGGLVGKLSNTLSLSLGYEIPEIHLKGDSAISSDKLPVKTCMVVIQARLTVDNEDVTSYLVLLLTVENFKTLISRLNSIL